MREGLRQLCVLAICSGVLLSLTPEGGAKRVLQVLVSAALLVTVFRTLGCLDNTALAPELARYRELERSLSARGSEARDRLNRLVIEQEYREYIESRAAALGIETAEVRIELRWSAEGFWIPERSRIRLPDAGGREALGRILETDFGIPPERQEWEVADGGEEASAEAGAL